MHLDPSLPSLVAILAVIFCVGLLLKLLRQPQVLGYLLTGIVIGPFGMALLTDMDFAAQLGNYGVVLLLFFVGMEVAPRQLAKGWRIAVVGTLIQVVLSIAMVIPLGLYLDWPVARIILLGFVISLSSTAVIVKLLRDSGELDGKLGQDILGILLVQDLVVIPMLIIIGLMNGEPPNWQQLGIQLAGGVTIFAVLTWALTRETLHLPWAKLFRHDHELQVFAALIICLGMSLLTGLAQLSTALGAFAAGILVNAAKETQWISQVMEPFRVVFVALFFVSVGVLVDLDFITQHIHQLILLVTIVLLGNTLLNGAILLILGYQWRNSLYAGAILSQIGEFAFVLAAIGFAEKIISGIGYQYTISVITLSILISPLWISAARRLLKVSQLNDMPAIRNQ